MKSKKTAIVERISLAEFKEKHLTKAGEQKPRNPKRLTLNVDATGKSMSTKDFRSSVASVENKSKFNAVKTYVDGILFDSKWEAKRYSLLKIREKAGEISDLKLQVSFPLIINDIKVATYISDFTYYDLINNSKVVEDSKGFLTPEYKIKKKLMKAIFDIDVLETMDIKSRPRKRK